MGIMERPIGTELSITDRYDWFIRLRGDGLSALEAFKEIRESEEHTALQLLVRGVISMVIGLIVLGAISDIWGWRYSGPTMFWIQSPSGRTIKEFPLYQALRIIRIRKWDFAKVEPVKPPRIISRREALHILFYGDKQT
jgi:MFS family permease